MSFCQKHRNHHCQHAHHCPHPQQHKASKKTGQLQVKQQSQQKAGGQLSNNCTFQGYISEQCSGNNQEMLGALREKQKVAIELGRETEQWRNKWEQCQHQNKHLYAQIQYYREQLSAIIQGNSTDTRLQIKKRLKQTTEWTLKIKSLETENIRLFNENQNLKRAIHDDKAVRMQNRHLNTSLQDKYNQLHHQLKIFSKERESLRQEVEQGKKRQARIQERYDLLRKQFNFECEQYRKEREHLTRELEECKRELVKTKGSSRKERQMAQLDRQSTDKKQQIYRSKLTQYESKQQELQNTIKQLTIKCQELTQDLNHAKAILQKNTSNTEEYQRVEKELEQHLVESRTVVRDNRLGSPITNKQNSSSLRFTSGAKGTESEQKLRQEIESLKLQIIELQSRNTSHFQEVIMNIGASEAFRRLVEQKNTIIKRLMREKGEIHAKNFQQWNLM